MDNTVAIAIVGAVVAVITLCVPLIAARQANKAATEREAAKNRRDDELEARLLAATRAVKHQAEEAARLLADNTAKSAKSTVEIKSQLKQVHILVNSAYTEAVRARLDAVRSQLVFMLKFDALKRSENHTPSDEETEAIVTTQFEIGRLENQLAERIKATEAVTQEQLTKGVAEAISFR